MTCFASLDLGSNTFRLLKATPLENPPFYHPVVMERAIVKMGKGVVKNGEFLSDSIEKGIEVLKDFSFKIGECERYRAVATGVFRESKNSDYFVREAKRETGISIEVIPAKEEAKLSFRGAINEVGLYNDRVLLIDIGGGSTEVTSGNYKRIIFTDSIPWGIVKLRDKFQIDYPTSNSKVEEITLFLGRWWKMMYNNYSKLNQENVKVILTGGTVTTLIMIEEGLISYRRREINGVEVDVALVEKWIKKISAMSLGEISSLNGMERGREDVFLPGLIMLKVFFDRFSLRRGKNSEGGLLEGALLSIKSEE